VRKSVAFGLSLLLILFGAITCKQVGPPKAGSATAADMLKLIPKDVQGVAMIDVHRVMTTDFVDKVIKESKDTQKYEEFVKGTGLDPQKDIYFAAVGFTAQKGLEEKAGQGAAVVLNLKYNKDTLLAMLKERVPELKQEIYEGIPIYSFAEKEGAKPGFGCFLDDSNIAFGQENEVKAVIDVVKKKAENVLQNAPLSALLKSVNKTAMVWSASLISAEAMKQAATAVPMLSSLASLSAATVYFDYKDKSVEMEARMMGTDAEKNKQIADLLNGLKAFGNMAAAKKPEIGELMNKIEITSAPDHVRIYAKLPEELLTKLGATAEEKIQEKLGTKPGEEKKSEEKPGQKKEIKK
jgi:hypothetical protein